MAAVLGREQIALEVAGEKGDVEKGEEDAKGMGH